MARNTLGGRYRIVEMIGRGGFGAVYKTRDEHFPSKPIVAIKEMNDAQLGPSEKAQALQQFRHEADLLAQLKHPNLLKVGDVFEEGGKAYLVMEFIEGKTLAQVQAEQNDPLDESLVAIFTNASQEEQVAAKKFRDFLLDVPQQRKALLSGFRPTNPNVSLRDSIPGNPFTDASLGFQVPDRLPSQVQAPSGDVTDALLNHWLVRYKTASTVLSTSTEQTHFSS
jgi:serine/threonine protein kinase